MRMHTPSNDIHRIMFRGQHPIARSQKSCNPRHSVGLSIMSVSSQLILLVTVL